jgi:S-adenosylmethionine synthetase
MNQFLFTSESVSEGHPDKVCDLIADSILDAYLERDPRSHVACEVLCKDSQVILAGEIKSQATGIDAESIARDAIRDIGYTDPSETFNADGVHITNLLGAQSTHTDQGVTGQAEQGAGDQGLMFGFATDETPELMPLPILLAHRLARHLTYDRKSGAIAWARPDAKTQVTVRYADHRPVEVTDVVVSTQHRSGVAQETIRDYVRNVLLPQALGDWSRPGIRLLVNPAGEFAIGGPTGDCGVTGRKIIVDTYGGFARHGGGAFSGKDPSKVDRSAAYFVRYVARQIVKRGLAHRAELQISYAIGVAQPISLFVETFGTGDAETARQFASGFDFRPAAIAQTLDLLRPIYRRTTNYGHFGKADLPWEQ